ncbi:MAG: class I fructose-bisphosphate aldolase [Candidatus Saccharimonadales bacterium]
MNTKLLEETAKQMVAGGKGLLAADESNNTCQKRFDAVGVECTEESRRQYRQILLTAPDAANILSGVIFYDETFWQKNDLAVNFRDFLKQQGILPGIKVDEGLVDLPGFAGEKLTKGLDGLPERMVKYAQAGARFAKWRAVITISDDDASDKTPTDADIDANAFVLARYARICQDNDIVPMVEPEVLFDGKHSIERCQEVMARTLDLLFDLLRHYKVHLPGVILKTSMVLPGKDSGATIDHQDVANRTGQVLRQHVPADLGGVVFLSGGQTPSDAFMNLNAIKKDQQYPWGLTFSFSRALQDPVLKAWAKNTADVRGPQQLFINQLQFAQQATNGELSQDQQFDDFVSGSQDL